LARSGLTYEFVGVVAPASVPGFRLLGSRAELASVLDTVRPDEVILTEADFDEHTVLEVVEQAHRQGIKVRLAPDTTELLGQRGEYVPGQGAPLFELRPPVPPGRDWTVKPCTIPSRGSSAQSKSSAPQSGQNPRGGQSSRPHPRHRVVVSRPAARFAYNSVDLVFSTDRGGSGERNSRRPAEPHHSHRRGDPCPRLPRDDLRRFGQHRGPPPKKSSTARSIPCVPV